MSANRNKTVDWNAPVFNRNHSISSAALFFAFLPGSSNFIRTSALLFAVNARAFIVNVVNPIGASITGGFRWLLEEDNTNIMVPGEGSP